ncbi:MAG: zinc-binding dehydrogenase [Dehalococcoidia bacterium]|nr:zinc-binding dehydrogenase [Dehalococcoidia bacterium]
MKAAAKPVNGKVEIVDIPVPTPGPDDIVIKMTMATVCGTDMHFVDEYPNELLSATFPGPHATPQGLLMGHEAIGIVHQAGANVTSVKPGDRVIAGCMIGCGKCHECMAVDFSTCTGGGRVLFGCQAEYYLVPFADGNVAKVPDSVSDEHAVLATDIMSTGFGAIERAGAGFGGSVAVFAQGPVGLCATAGARARGCGLIVAVDTVPERLEMSKKFGANVTINPREEDPIARIMSLTDNKGVEVAVEAVGTQATFEAATRAVRRGGTVSSVGVYGLTPAVSMPTLAPSFLHRQIITTLCPAGRDRMEHLLGLLANGNINLAPLFTHRMKLADTAAAYDLFRGKAEGVLKIAITP